MPVQIKIQNSKLRINAGQSLVEVLIALGIGVILIGVAATTIVPMLRSNLETRTVQVASQLTQEYLDNIQSLSEYNWNSIASTTKGQDSKFHLTPISAIYEITSGPTSTIIGDRAFTRYFFVENVNRDSCGVGDITVGTTTLCTGPKSIGVAEDSSTQKITVIVSWENNRSISKIQYLTRNRNKVFVQTDWSGGFGQENPITSTSTNNKFATSTDIDYSTTKGSIIIKF